MDDVCPWDAAPPVAASPGRTPSAESAAAAGSSSSSLEPGQPSSSSSQQQQRSSRKNSSQLDSCSSSSDVSVAIAEVSERLRKTGPGPGKQQPQQQIQRNYSVGSQGTVRVKLAETARASVSTCNFPSPQQSFDLSYVAPGPPDLGREGPAALELGPPTPGRATTTTTTTPLVRSVETVPEEVERQERAQPPTRSAAFFASCGFWGRMITVICTGFENKQIP